MPHFGETRYVYKILVGNSEKKGPRLGPRCGWEDVTKMNLKERKYQSVDHVYVTENMTIAGALRTC